MNNARCDTQGMETKLIRKSLDMMIRDAAAERGLSVEVKCTDRLTYSIDGGEFVSPGDAAKALGVEWNLNAGIIGVAR